MKNSSDVGVVILGCFSVDLAGDGSWWFCFRLLEEI